jgi:hypothetical protein
MNDEELLQQQVVMSTSASLGQSVWVYRGSMWAYPWYTSVRKTLASTHSTLHQPAQAAAPTITTALPVQSTSNSRHPVFLNPFSCHQQEDPAYADWYVPFKPQGPWYSSKCDNNYDPPLCSDLYHNQCVFTTQNNPQLPTRPPTSI